MISKCFVQIICRRIQKNNRMSCTKLAIRTNFCMRKAGSCPTNRKRESNASGEHISVHAHAIGWHLFVPLSRIIALFSTYASVNFYPLEEWIWLLPTAEYPQPYQLRQFTNPSPSHLPLSSSSQMYTPLYFANSRKQR